MGKTYSVTATPVKGGGVLLKLAFGEPAQNTAIVRDAAAAVKDLNLDGGITVYLNGPASLPVTLCLGHAVMHLFTEVAAFDPKLNGYVVAVSHGGREIGTLIPAADVVAD